MTEKQKTRIFRHSKANNYTVINNEILRRDDISWKAKGIMCYVLSLPDDWEIYLEELMKHATDKKASFRSGWSELIKKGYVRRYPIRDNGKIVEWRTEIRENAVVEPILPLTDFQEVENLEVENLEVENRKLLSTYSTKYLDIQNTNITNKDMADSKTESDYTSPKSQQFEEIWKIYPSARRKNKKGCKAKFDKVVKCQADIDLIRDDLTRYIEYTIKSNTEASYIATSQTYFNQERWNDGNSYEVVASPKKQFYGNKGPTKKETLPDWVDNPVKETPMSEEDQAKFKQMLVDMRAGGKNPDE